MLRDQPGLGRDATRLPRQREPDATLPRGESLGHRGLLDMGGIMGISFERKRPSRAAKPNPRGPASEGESGGKRFLVDAHPWATSLRKARRGLVRLAFATVRLSPSRWRGGSLWPRRRRLECSWVLREREELHCLMEMRTQVPF